MVTNKKKSLKLPSILAWGGMRRRLRETAERWCDDDVRATGIDAAQHHL
jgi:hypothetical protein